MSILISWISFALHTLVLGNPIISWVSSIVLVIFILWFCLIEGNSEFIKYVFLPLSIISLSSFDFYSGEIFATGFFQHLSLDMVCILIFFFRFLYQFLNLNKTIKLSDLLTIILIILCLISSTLGYFSNFKNYNWILYLPICFVVYSYILELRDKGHIIDAEKYSKILLLMFLSSWIILGLKNGSHAFFIIPILFYIFFLRIDYKDYFLLSNYKKISLLNISLLLVFLLFFFVNNFNFTNSLSKILLLFFFLLCFVNPFSISFFFKLFIFLGSIIPAVIIYWPIKLPAVLADYRSETHFQNFNKLEYLAYKIFDDRLALWFGALNKITEKGFFYNLLRQSGDTFLPSLSRVFHGDFFVDKEWSGLSHSGFIEVYFQGGLITGIICFILIERFFNINYGNVKTTNYLLISIFILLFLGNFIVTKSILILWVFLGLYANKNVIIK